MNKDKIDLLNKEISRLCHPRQMVQLTLDFFKALRPSKHFPSLVEDQPAAVSSSLTAAIGSIVPSLDFDASGEFLVTSSPVSDSIQLFGCEEGESKKVIFSKKYGVGQIKFAHRASTVIYASTKGDDNGIRYLSLHDNKYLRYFRGHSARVTQLCLNPLNDTFISLAPKESLCIWDLRTPHMQGRLNLTDSIGDSTAFAAFDPQGLIFAVGTGSKYLRLYDARNWERGAFSTFELSPSPSPGNCAVHWTNLQFSPDGKEILVTLNSDASVGSVTSGIVLDSFDGVIKGSIDSASPDTFSNILTFTPDSKYILGARPVDGQLDVWDAKERKLVIEGIEGITRDPVRAIAFNPKFAMLASINHDNSTAFYI